MISFDPLAMKVAGGLSPDERLQLIERFGSVEEAKAEAERRDPEGFSRLWDSFGEWPDRSEFWAVYWTLALPTLGFGDSGEREPSKPRSQEKLDLGGEGYSDDEIKAMQDLLREGQFTARKLEDRGDMSFRRALRIWHWFDAGAILWEDERVRAGPGFRLVARKTTSGRRWSLSRSESTDPP